jgi:hypothetical protein
MEKHEGNFDLPDSGFNDVIENISQQRGESHKQEKLVTYTESLQLAKELSSQYETTIKSNMYKDVDGWGEPYTDYQKSIGYYLKQIPDDIQERFQGHGITRNDEIDQLAGALNILANKSIKGYCGRLGGETTGYEARTNGNFLVVSRIDKGLPITKEQDGRQQSISDEIGWKADIGAFVVDTKYYPMIDELKIMFPDVNIIKANELPSYLTKFAK